MRWFEQQLRYREEMDDAVFEEALESIAGAVMGYRLKNALQSHEIAASAIGEILRFYNLKGKTDELPPQVKTVEEQINYCMRPFGIQNRRVILDKGWYKDAVGPMLGTLKEDGTAVALIPGMLYGYSLVDIASGKRIPINSKNQDMIDQEAVCFYEPLPGKSLKIIDLLKFMVRQLSISDGIMYLGMMGISTLLGLFSPLFTRWLMGDVLESGSVEVLLALAVFMISFSIANLLFGAFRNMINSRIGIKQSIAVEAAVMNRIMSLPPTFFKKYSAGELSRRSSYVQTLCSTLFNTIANTGLTSLFSLVYIGQIFAFAPSLVLPSIAITIATIVLSLITTFAQMGITQEKMQLSAKTGGMTYAMISGIQKIKLAGAEKRMFSRWAKCYSQEAQLEYNPPMFLKLSGTLSLALSLLGTLIIYGIAIKNHVGISDYYAFNSAYGMVSGAFMSLSSIAITIANIRPTLEMARPIMEAEPEIIEGGEVVTDLRGNIEFSHITFKYDENMPNVIDDLSLKIKSGEYLAIVGSTGCGKSTLIRLLLGFEKPQKGGIFFDNRDMAKLDLESLRNKIGTVLQDGKLFSGDIYSNIVIAAPQLSMDEAWEAAEIASIAEDIRKMPMGMHTLISEGQGGISGGQRQRLIIARAVAPKPKILIFDEATSALDNITQKHVSDAVDSLKCTRIVIAHRLSTIQHADRIIYLEGGKIIEEGKYEDLIALNGKFAKLVERQRLDVETE